MSSISAVGQVVLLVTACQESVFRWEGYSTLTLLVISLLMFRDMYSIDQSRVRDWKSILAMKETYGGGGQRIDLCHMGVCRD